MGRATGPVAARRATLIGVIGLVGVIGLLGLASTPSRAQTAAAPIPDTLAQRLKACTECHGPEGRAGPDGYYPRLAGKPAGYLYNQLVAFRDGSRHYLAMNFLLGGMTDRYLHEIAGFFSEQHPSYPPPPPSSADAATLARGEKLVREGDPALRLPACQACHGSELVGVEPAVPALIGLPRDYLNAQLGAWKDGMRHARAPDCMAEIARRLSDADANAVSAWLAAAPVRPGALPLAHLPAPSPISCGSLAPGDGP